jgi:hypothetical protein
MDSSCSTIQKKTTQFKKNKITRIATPKKRSPQLQRKSFKPSITSSSERLKVQKENRDLLLEIADYIRQQEESRVLGHMPHEKELAFV